MANQWFRMYGEFATDPKVQMLSEANQRRYVMLLCLRCSDGDVTLQDEEVAFQLRISGEEWASTKATLMAKKLITDDNRPTAWDKRQYVSDSSSERVAAHRARKKAEKKQACNVTETPPDTDTDTELNPTHTPAGEPAAPAAGEQPAPIVTDGPFLMTLDWEPDQDTLNTLALCAGLPKAAVTREAIGGFLVHHSSSGITKTTGQWHSALVNWIKRDYVRDARVVQMPRRPAAQPAEDWAAEGVVL
jgi:hypothetical protein